MRIKWTLLLLIPFCTALQAQEDTTLLADLPTISVSVSRLALPPEQLPIAVTQLELAPTKAIQQQLSVNEYLPAVPGLFAMNANNFAQDLRLSIRGFGARAAFGIRGVKLVVDGIPETTPDGQGQVDNLDLGLLQNIQILRGPAAGLYGNAAGGVVSMQTQQQVNQDYLLLGATFGSFGFRRYQLQGGLRTQKVQAITQLSYNSLSGFRQNSGLQHATGSANVTYEIDKKQRLQLLLNFTQSPRADDPGSLNLEDLNADRRMARDRNVQFQTGESVRQLKVGLKHQLEFSPQAHWETTVFYIQRQFDGKLPFGFGGIVDLNRDYAGAMTAFVHQKKITPQIYNQLRIGTDLFVQRDDRQRFQNNDGQIGDLTFHQIEQFNNLGIYLTDVIEIRKNILLNASLRYDRNALIGLDQVLSNGDASDSIYYNTFNGSFGLRYALTDNISLYTRTSTSFETPTLSELSINIDGKEGLNSDLTPQRAHNWEIGIKHMPKGSLSYELTYFRIRTKDEILPFEVEDFPDRDFFANAGETERQGIEAKLSYQPHSTLYLTGSYTYSHFVFREYNRNGARFDGQFLPGIPQHTGYVSAVYQPTESGLTAQLQSRYVGALFADDGNTTEVSAFIVTDLRLGYALERPEWTLTPFFGVNNLFDAEYNDNIRINAFGGRFYEAAPGRNFYGGFRMRL